MEIPKIGQVSKHCLLSPQIPFYGYESVSVRMAFVHIPIKELRVGMYIVQTGESWVDKPFLYAKPGLIKNEAEISAIVKQGFLEAYYDPDRSLTKSDSDDLLTARLVQSPFTQNSIVSLSEEIAIQEKYYNNCVTKLQTIMEEARSGHIDFSSAQPLVFHIIESIQRNVDALTSLAKVKTYDTYTYAHCVNVSIYSIAFGKYLNLTEQEIIDLGVSGLFHDIGKMKIPTSILNVPRKLTEEEFAYVKKHVEFGEEMLAKLPNIKPCILEGILEHHERIDGNGYPKKKKGSEISRFGRILAICDVYDALTSRRVYKNAIPPSQALTVMYGMREEAWHTEPIELFIKMLGIYPVGTPVQLTGGFKGIVVKSNTNAPLYPTVLVCMDKNKKKIVPPTVVELAKQHDYQIIKAIQPNDFPFDIFTALKTYS